MKKTKIVATIGPASESPAVLSKMIKSGLNVARLNFSHGTYDNHRTLIKNIRSTAKKLKANVAIMQDLQGPRIRTGDVPKEGIPIKKNQTLILAPQSYKSTKHTVIPIQYENLYKDVKKGHPILIEDGTIELEVISIKAPAITCKVKVGQLIKSHKGMNFPKSTITAPPVTAKDIKDLEFGISQDVDLVALSFVKDAKDVKGLKKRIEKLEGTKSGIDAQHRTRVIAKIERPEAIDNFDEILDEVDGIMVARGDLGLEIPIQQVPVIQKNIIRRCIQESKPVIVATQMLDSMIRNPVPTRAEVSDVANAILDGTDAVMLSGESATGQYPDKAVGLMKKIADSVEPEEIQTYQLLEENLKLEMNTTEAVGFSVQDIAEEINASAIVAVTDSGFTARSIAKFRSHIPVIAITRHEKTKNQLVLSWGVEAHCIKVPSSFDALVSSVRELVKKEYKLKAGDKIVIAASHPFGKSHETNLVTIQEI